MKKQFTRDYYQATYYKPPYKDSCWNLYRKGENVGVISEDGKSVSMLDCNTSHSQEDIFKIVCIMTYIERQFEGLELIEIG
ncbi:MAG: hypothetical protein V4547_16750 [Bacteroidota bacterium]